MQIYSLLDRKLKEFGPPVTARNDEVVRRIAVDGIRGTKSLSDLHPEDFDIMHVGEFDEDKGVIVGATPRLVANLFDVFEVTNGPR